MVRTEEPIPELARAHGAWRRSPAFSYWQRPSSASTASCSASNLVDELKRTRELSEAVGKLDKELKSAREQIATAQAAQKAAEGGVAGLRAQVEQAKADAGKLMEDAGLGRRGRGRPQDGDEQAGSR